MNIVSPALTAIPLNTANVNTESVRRDNIIRETVPKPANSDKSAGESGLGSESDRVKTPGQPPQPTTYEKPSPNGAQQDGQLANNKDNGEDPSAGKQDAESRQQEQQQAADKKEIEQLKRRDAEVRAHEQAHASVGGQYAGSPQYEFELGPDGKQYAVGGEVSIDISEEKTPEQTLRKMEQVRAAALAPAEPSGQDLRVAAEAQQQSNEARQEISAERQEASREVVGRLTGDEEQQEQGNGIEAPSLNDIVDGGVRPPNRSLKEEEDPVAQAAGLETPATEFRRQVDSEVAARSLRIAAFYSQVSQPTEPSFRQNA
ncbi:putative metalloprotease CJM1_0395 family protein [Aliiglaciecola sp. CAU 1673]|uniref:putative metalloprotease CJM1_0395 family protein n=1 Tax=Aliiglaciecola sp. CAU 1673 TaxID=3032595 RepID=UPI0023DA2052|nr:putative metalloprotease CJM1_0395 family protein [Aliiglaciecola sp. CAU 1673]MDF2179242.1 putative metalloprotease CJM1_0395 family protein [Aliiglaciecola sp. CAU 1673]